METIYTAVNAYTGYAFNVLREVDEDGTRYLVTDEMGAFNTWGTEEEVLEDVREALDNALETCEQYAEAVVGRDKAPALITAMQEFVEAAYTGLEDLFEN